MAWGFGKTQLLLLLDDDHVVVVVRQRPLPVLVRLLPQAPLVGRPVPLVERLDLGPSSSSWIAHRICLIVIDGDHWPCHVPSGSFNKFKQMRPLLHTFRCQKTSPGRLTNLTTGAVAG